jgi:hypothetical protein
LKAVPGWVFLVGVLARMKAPLRPMLALAGSVGAKKPGPLKLSVLGFYILIVSIMIHMIQWDF